MNDIWAATGVVLLAITGTLCLPAPALGTLPASHAVPPVVRHRAAPELVVQPEGDHGHTKKSKVVHEAAANPQVVEVPNNRHQVITDQGVSHKVVQEPDLKHQIVPESPLKSVTIELEEKHTILSAPGVEHEVINEPATGNNVIPEPAKKLGIPNALRPAGDEVSSLLRPGLGRPDDVGEASATTTTSTTTLDQLTAFCQEACREGMGGPECNCPGHPVGRRHAPPFTP